MLEQYRDLKGIVDLHIHGAPDVYQRPFDEYDIACKARDLGYKAILFKSHFTTNANRILLLKKFINNIEIFGNITLNQSVGGLNPHAVYAAIQLGVKEIKMPTAHAKNHMNKFGAFKYPHHNEILYIKPPEVEGIYILNQDGKVVPELDEILRMVAENDLILSTGHISPEESLALVKEAKKFGVKNITVTHAEYFVVDIPIEIQEQLADLGAYIEHCFFPTMPIMDIDRLPRTNPWNIAENIRRVGPERCVMSTDFGQFFNPSPIEGMRMFIQSMLKCGINKDEIQLMTVQNPSKLIGLV